jgi:hypothetical protein
MHYDQGKAGEPTAHAGRQAARARQTLSSAWFVSPIRWS